MGVEHAHENPVYAAENLAARRGDRRLFAGLGFSLCAGDALVLRGANGSGKSTLLRLMAGFGRPTAGRFLWNGQPVSEEPERHRVNLHYVGHQEALKPALTMLETLQFWCDLSGRADADALPALDALGIVRLASLPCRFLSAGQRRRLGLARLLAWRTPLWLLDEPVVGLDSEAIAILTGLIESHRHSGGIVVLSTHQDMALVGAQSLSLADFPPPAILRAAFDTVWER